jgi:hypothetical protein
MSHKKPNNEKDNNGLGRLWTADDFAYVNNSPQVPCELFTQSTAVSSVEFVKDSTVSSAVTPQNIGVNIEFLAPDENDDMNMVQIDNPTPAITRNFRNMANEM